MIFNQDNKVLYIHYRKTDNQIFYVGYGDLERPQDKSGRNKHWHNTVNKYGYEYKILETYLSKDRACELEIIMIAFYGRKDKGLGTLVNQTDGGEGSNANADKTIYTWQNLSGKIIHCTRSEMSKTYNLKTVGLYKLVNGKTPTYKGWSCLNPRKTFIRKQRGTIYTFISPDGEEVKCVPSKLYKKYNLTPACITSLTQGRVTNHKGWTCLDVICKVKKLKDDNTYNFEHKDGTIEVCTRDVLIKKYNLNKGNISSLILGKKYKSVKGWKIKKDLLNYSRSSIKSMLSIIMK